MLAYLTLTGYQQQVAGSGEGSLQSLVSRTNLMLKIESVDSGDILLRNLGRRSYSNARFFLDGRPLDTSGPGTCPSGNLCSFVVDPDIDCTGTQHKLGMGRDTPVQERTVTCCDLGLCREETLITTFSITSVTSVSITSGDAPSQVTLTETTG